MISIIENKSFIRGTYYEKWRISSLDPKEKYLEHKIKIWAIKKVDEQGLVVMFLYDSKMNVIPETFDFLNIELSNLKTNSREKNLYALKFLYCFIQLFNVDYRKLSDVHCNMLMDFLEGKSRKGQTVLDLHTRRSPDVVNDYLAVYKKFLKYQGVLDSPLYSTRLIAREKDDTGVFAHTRKKMVLTSVFKRPSMKDKNRVPKYIKHKEFILMLRIIRENEHRYSLRDEVIIRLMYENGMRIGEVFGLTMEDIETTPLDLVSARDNSLGSIVIKNRLTDKRYQSSKSLFAPQTKEDYESGQYLTEDIGWERIYTSSYLLKKIFEYIDLAHGGMSARNRENYIKNSKADKVTTKKLQTNDNYYLFLNKNGTPISTSGSNGNMRQLFLDAGLGIDKGRKVNNLNHRFRHGFAMYHVKYNHVEAQVLQKLLRHRSITSTLIYYNPDDEDIVQMNMENKESIYERYPELKY